jgi:hypothetical protein
MFMITYYYPASHWYHSVIATTGVDPSYVIILYISITGKYYINIGYLLKYYSHFTEPYDIDSHSY